jgi:hypothetical protein
MKTASCLILILLGYFLNSSAQSLHLADIWHLQRGDYNQDSLKQILQTKKLNLKYNEIVTIELQNADNQPFTYQYRILKTEKFTDWREIGSSPIIQLPLLDGGEYLLEISSKHKPKSILFKLNIAVKKTIWQEAWFIPSIIIYVLFLIGIGVYFFSLYNLRQKLKIARCTK